MYKQIREILVVLILICSISLEASATMKIESPAFEDKGRIPRKYTCQGEDINPVLNISGIPVGAKSLALIVDDPDAPMGTWVHWVVYNIPLVDQIAENTIPGKQGDNDFGRKDYGGPCPPSGEHRYYFKLYALDTLLPPKNDMSKEDLLSVMKGHILEETVVMGTYIKE